MRGCTIWSGTSCIWSHISQFALWRTLTASYCIPVIPVKTLKGVWNDFQQPQFQFLRASLCSMSSLMVTIIYWLLLCGLDVLVMSDSCIEWSLTVFVCFGAFTVLPAWWMEAVSWEETPVILYSGAYRHRFRTTLLLLSDLLWGRGQPTGEIKAIFFIIRVYFFKLYELVPKLIYDRSLFVSLKTKKRYKKNNNILSDQIWKASSCGRYKKLHF